MVCFDHTYPFIHPPARAPARVCVAEAHEMIIGSKLVILLLVVVAVGQTNGDDDEEVVRFTVDPAGATTHHTAKLVL